MNAPGSAVAPAMLGAVAAGGAAGSLLRYLIGVWAPRPHPSAFPVATLAINVMGSLALGWLLRRLEPGAVASATTVAPALRAALTVGVCGGFTTFSTFSVEVVTLLQAGRPVRALLYVLVSVAAGVAAAWGALR